MMKIDHRRIRRSFGSRVSRRQGTKLNTSAVRAHFKERPSTRKKNLIRDIRAGLVDHPGRETS